MFPSLNLFWKWKADFYFSEKDKDVISLLVNTGDEFMTSFASATKLGNVSILESILKNSKTTQSHDSFNDYCFTSAAEAAVLKYRCDLLTLVIDKWKEVYGTDHTMQLSHVLFNVIDKWKEVYGTDH